MVMLMASFRRAGGGRPTTRPGGPPPRSSRAPRDVGVGQVVAVAEDDGRTLGRRQRVGEMLELGVGRPAVLDRRARAARRAAGRARRPVSIATRAAIVSTHARRCSPCSSRS